MKYRSFVTFLVLAISVLALTAPVYAQEEEVVIPAAPCDEPGELTMWVWDVAWYEIIGNSIAAWEENYCPGAVVDLQQYPWDNYWDLLKTAIAGGDTPDVFNMIQPYSFFYLDNDVLLNLQPYFDAAGIDTTVWSEGMVGPYRWGENGDLYAGPVNWDTVAIYYNKDMFEAAGLDLPTADWTWDDFAEYAEALTTDEVYGAAVYLEYQSGYANWIAATGVTPVVEAGRTRCTFTDEGSIEALQFLKDLLDAGYMPSVSIVGSTSPDQTFDMFKSEQVAMMSTGPWKIPLGLDEVEFNWDLVTFPRHPETGRSRSILHAVGYVAAADTENPDLAANLIQFLISDEGQMFFAESGSVAPANPNPALQQLWVNSFGETDVNIQAFVDATEDAQGVTIFSEIDQYINNEFVINIFDLDMDVEEAAQLACDFMAEYLTGEAE